MTELSLKKLQNGSDIRGIALEGIEGQIPNLKEEEAARLAAGFVCWLKKKLNKEEGLAIAIGRDPRLSGPALLTALTREFNAYGIKVLDAGLASTPAMFMATQFEEVKADGAIMITASHLPFNRNGFKFFTAGGGLDKKDIKEIIEYAEGEVLPMGEDVRCDIPLMDLYCNHLKKMIIDGVGEGDRPLAGLKITVDAGNGSGGFYASEILEPLGADVSSSQFLEPDGSFPNHAPNPEDKAAMKSISEKVISSEADFGLIFDTDVDRSAAVDGKGKEIARNGIVAMAAALVAEDHPGTTVVTDSITSDQLNVFLEEKLGMKHLRFKRGYRNVINRSVELNEAGEESWLAIETSGHAALKENYFLDDGAYLATKIVIKAAKLAKEGKTLDSMIADLEEPEEAIEIRFPITTEDFAPYADKVLEDLKAWAVEQGIEVVSPNYEGVRLKFDGGWCLLRKSLHDPIMPFNVEADEKGGVDKFLEKIMPFIRQYEYIEVK